MKHQIDVFQPIGWHGILVARNPRGIWYKSVDSYPEFFRDGMKDLARHVSAVWLAISWLPMTMEEINRGCVVEVHTLEKAVRKFSSSYSYIGSFEADQDVPQRFGIRDSRPYNDNEEEV